MGRLNRERARKVLRSITLIADESEREGLLRLLAMTADRPVVVSFVNAHAYNLAWKDEVFTSDLCHSDYLLRDGAGMSVMLRALGMPEGLNMNGTDLTPLIVRAFAGRRVAVCGTAEPYLSKAVEMVKRLGGDVVLAKDGFAPLEAYFSAVEEAGPDLIILGMGMPKQERLSILLRGRLQAPVVIINGGAILDFWAGRFPRAPLAWQKARMEWLFRLIQEPRRLWRRYLLGNALFLWRTLLLRLTRS